MRLAPVVLFAGEDTGLAGRLASLQSRTTHAAPEAVDACVLLAALLHEAIHSPRGDLFRLRPFKGAPAVSELAAGSWRGKTRSAIRSSGYVMHTLEAAIWCVHKTSNFEEALVFAANLGQDADTVGAVTGQLAGAIYGLRGIPKKWLEPLALRRDLEQMAKMLISRPSGTDKKVGALGGGEREAGLSESWLQEVRAGLFKAIPRLLI